MVMEIWRFVYDELGDGFVKVEDDGNCIDGLCTKELGLVVCVIVRIL